MSTEPLRHVVPGEPFRPDARSWNAFVDAARTVNEQRTIFGVPQLGGSGAAQPTCLRIRGTIAGWVDGPHGRAARVTVVRKMGTGDVPQIDDNNQILVYDKAGCVFLESEGALTGRVVWADFTSPVDQSGDCAEETGTADNPTSLCYWDASGVCCES